MYVNKFDCTKTTYSAECNRNFIPERTVINDLDYNEINLNEEDTLYYKFTVYYNITEE